ncbi:MAG: hypothetical protein KGQ75_15745 [Sphingomonadales bacterium]|uniref:hypothetical protein n=1 Tax=Novosphingobium sp. NDB2Meth1 TaxID=1892847 RepID=UPI000AAEDB02|nr:hypothetical protein [Novosphingobium sp. NDB2Meth1]MBU6396023.1 hypothetical protein [Sphingomonadales bacterium]
MRRLALAPVFLLAACGPGAPPPPPPASTVQPEPITYPDIKDNELYGAGCNFTPEGGGMSALALAQEGEAIIKVKGKIERIPADKKSQILPETARTRYLGPDRILLLAPLPDAKPVENGVVKTLATSLTIMDPLGRIQFFAKGVVQCKPM